MHQVFLGIGGNIGNKPENFRKVYQLIEEKIGKINLGSDVYETPPWGFHAGDDFWNQVLQVKTDLNPEQVLDAINEIETAFGRKRESPTYESREMDVDILYFDDLFMETDELTIPHPRLHQRKFVMVPLAQIAPDYRHPLLRLTNLQLLENCRDESVIKIADTKT